MNDDGDAGAKKSMTRFVTVQLARRAVPAVIAIAAAAASCARVDTNSTVDVKPIEVKPIHITVDVNVRVDHELDNFFAFEDDATKPAGGAATKPSSVPAATSPATAPAAAAASDKGV